MDYSQEQKDIFEFAKKGIKNLIVQAVAGAGKTTTLVGCVNQISDDKRILLLAHNTSTRDTLLEKIGKRKNVKVLTLHGLGYRILQENLGTQLEIDEDKYRNYILQNRVELFGAGYKTLNSSSKQTYRANVFDLVSKARLNLKQSEKEIKKVAKKYGLSLMADENKAVEKILKWGFENIKTVDYLDLLWLPGEFGFHTKRYLSDFIMLDEAQDVSIAQQDLIKRCLKRDTRLFAFGDTDQLINSWAGSDYESFEHLKDPNEFNRPAQELPLTTNYRCGKKIIEYAKQYTDSNIHAKEDAEDGSVNFDVFFNNVKDGDMVLCRNTAPLMKAYKLGLSQGKKMYFRGKEIGKTIQQTVDSADGDTLEEILISIKKRLIATWERVTLDSGLDENEVICDRKILSLLDIVDAIEAFPKSVLTRKDIEAFINDVFTDEKKNGVELSTIHKAKGLEADNVFIICPSLIPSKLAKLDWQIEEEKHLQYVMCTRPKESLNFVTEKDIRPNVAFLGQKSLYNELKKIRDEVYEYKEEQTNNI